MAIPQHIAAMLEKRLAGEPVSARELMQLRQWYEQGEAANNLFGEENWEEALLKYVAAIDDEERNNDALRRFLGAADFADRRIPVDGPLNMQDVQADEIPETVFVHGRVSVLHNTWVRYAAAILLIAGSVAVFKLLQQKGPATAVSQQPTVSDILPGSDRAVLVLADGSKIVLDSAANGQLAEQGGARVLKQSNGQIVYDLQASADVAVMWNTISTPRGGQYRVQLPDGTAVWLNSASSITYPTIFNGNERRIKVTGEVYLEVLPNTEQPFFVDINGKSSVQVLGTRFNINSYADEEAIKITLIGGKVKVNQQVVLNPGQQAIQALNAASDKIVVKSSVDVEQVLAWKNGLFNFKGADFKSVLRQLEKWYDIKIDFSGKYDDMTMDGKMDRNVHLDDVIRFFNSYGFETKLENRTLIVIRK